MVDVIKRRITGVSDDSSADSGTYKVVVHDVYGNIISSSTVATVS